MERRSRSREIEKEVWLESLAIITKEGRENEIIGASEKGHLSLKILIY